MAKDWISLEEAIDHIVQTTGCSRRVARKKLAKAAKQNKLQMTLGPEAPGMTALSPQEAVRRHEEDPASLLMPLNEFLDRCHFTQDELMGELRSGRLTASASESTLFRIEMGSNPASREFVVDLKSVAQWMANPKTPPHLLAKFQEGLKHKPH